MIAHIQAALLIGGTVIVLISLGAHLYRSLPARLDALAVWWRGLVADARAIDLDAPTLPRRLLDREERGRERSKRAHRRDLATGPAQLATLVDLTTWDDATDDAVPVDMAALMVEQDMEEGREFVSRIEHMLAVETAVTFGFVYLGASR